VKIERTWWGEDGLMAEAVIPEGSPEAKAIREGALAHFSIDPEGFSIDPEGFTPTPPPSLEEMGEVARAVREAVDKAVAEAVDNRTYVVPTEQVAEAVRKAVGFHADVVVNDFVEPGKVLVVPNSTDYFRDLAPDVIRIQDSLRNLRFLPAID